MKINVEPKKYLFIAGHLSTGGGPKYLEWLVKKIKNEGNFVRIIEWNLYSDAFTVQRKEIIKTVGHENFVTVGKYDEEDSSFYNREKFFKKYISDYAPDYIHLNELPEMFAIKPMSKDFLDFLYSKNRSYKILETCHNSQFDFANKLYLPDAFWFCSEYHLNISKNLNIEKRIVEMEIPDKIRPDRNKTLLELGLDPEYYHVLQVGLFHKNKNQKFTFDVAKNFLHKKIKFHFLGNLCFIGECDIDKNQKNCIIWGERNDVDKFMSCMDLFILPSFQELNPISIKEALSWGMKCFVSDLDVYRDKYKNNKNIIFLKDNNFMDYVNNLNLSDSNEIKKENSLIPSFDPFVKIEISGDKMYKYCIKFIDKSNNEIFYETFLNTNMWASSTARNPADVLIKVENLITREDFSFEKKKKQKIAIINESSSLGDTLAWTPMVNRFAVEKNIEVDFYTPHKSLFIDQYPYINFKDYSEKNNSSTASKTYILSYEFDRKDNLKNLQEIAASILNLNYTEEKPRLNIDNTKKKNFSKKYVCIATHSTSQCKYWNNPTGWSNLVKYLKSLDYEVVCIDKNKYYGISDRMNTIPEGCIDKTGDLPLEDRINDILHCDFFIGLSSGLSWLAWALNKPVVMISGFTKAFNEFNTPYRIINENVCNGCWNDKNEKFEPSNWLWCPRNKDFECSKQITFEMVKEKIDQVIKDTKTDLMIEEISFTPNLRASMKKFIESTAIEIFDHEQYERFVKIENNDLFVDLGCSLGYMYFKHKEKNIQYIGVDGSIDCLKDFYENLNGDDAPILINSFISNDKKVYNCAPFFHDTAPKDVVSISFKDLIKLLNRKIDFLKFDIEGAELDIFDHKINYDLFKKYVKKFSGEFHLLNSRTTREKMNEVLNKLRMDNELSIRIYSVDCVDITESYWSSGDYYTEIIVSGFVK